MASSTRNNFVLPAVFLLVVAGVVGLQGLSGPEGSVSGQNTKLVPPPSTRPAFPAEFRGITLQLHSGDPKHPYEKLIDEIAETGANTLQLVVPGYQENASSTSIFLDARRGPGPRRVVELVKYAKGKGLMVVLMPIVLLSNAREGEWRGKIKPQDWGHWWGEYNSFILHNAGLAQEGGADVFMVGSELILTEYQTDRWRALIADVRKAYKGRLSYSSNWDHYTSIAWWDDLDLIGMTTYYDLSHGKKPTLDVLLDSWRPIRKEILDWQATVNRPILFTEVGWPNQVTGAEFPWDYYRSPNSPDPQAQANCYESFFRTWANDPSSAGWIVWEWRTGLDQKADEKDTGYSPQGKPAMAIVKKYFEQARIADSQRPPPAVPTTQNAPQDTPALLSPAPPMDETSVEPWDEPED